MLSSTALLSVLLLALLGSLVLAQECIDKGVCDSHERCPVWAVEGACIEESAYMLKFCPVSCTLPTKASNEECVDHHPRCELFASTGECRSKNSYQMRKFCPKSCKLCGQKKEQEGGCVDNNEDCGFWASRGECDGENSDFVRKICPKSCNLCSPLKTRVTASNPTLNANHELLKATQDFGKQQEATGSEAAKIIDVIKKSIAYMESEAMDLPVEVLEKCLNRNKLCSFWATIGECEGNPAYMTTNCAPACRTCNLIDMALRCPPLENAQPALVPGALNKMFETIVKTAPGNRTLSPEERKELEEQEMPEYTVNVISRPPPDGGDTLPWVIVFDNITTPEECQHLIDIGHKVGYERSRDVGTKQFDGTFDGVESDRRTSENAWCSVRNNCRTDEVVQRIQNRIGTVTGIKPENSEDLQILKYQEGQFYRSHHDYISHHRDRQCGPRILTFFLYLSNVEGGGTRFNKLNKVVEPKVGRAVLWPSVLDSDPLQRDPRTMHEAEPVKAGKKYAANGWIHLYDYVAASERGCT